MDDLLSALVEKHVTGSEAFKADALRFGKIVADVVAEAQAAELAALRAELAEAREALEGCKDFLIGEMGFEDDDAPLASVLTALKAPTP